MWWIRVLLVGLGVWLGAWAGLELARVGGDPLRGLVNTVSLAVAGALLGLLLSPRAEVWAGALQRRTAGSLARLSPQGVAAATVGALVALLASVLLSTLLSGAPFFRWWFSVLLTLGLGWFFVAFALRYADAFRGLNWLPQERAAVRRILDTNVIIDGRVAPLVRFGVMDGPLHVPGFVLAELQYQADHADPERRGRGKRGLEVLDELRELGAVSVLAEGGLHGGERVDDALVRLCSAHRAALISNDANLARVARLHGVRVVSVHEAALALRPQYRAGETVQLKITKPGQQSGQGVGYLEDGTMMVVDGAGKHRGRVVNATVVSQVQTQVGRMVFGRLEAEVPAESAPGTPAQQSG